MSSRLRKHKLAVIVPTKDRPETLTRLLNIIRDQSYRPEQIIVVDGSDNPVNDVVDGFYDMSIDYVRIHPPGLTKQKNAGVANIAHGITLLAFIDDDMVLEDDSLEFMMRFWDDADLKFGGASFNITTSDPPDAGLRSFFKSIFFISNNTYGTVHKSGFNTSIWNTDSNQKVKWLGGGYTVWRKEVFNELRFDEWFPGSGLWEDVLFSFNVSKAYELAVVANAKASHMETKESLKGQVKLGRTQIINWVYFVSRNKELSLLMCLWGCVGRIIINLTKGIGKLDIASLLKGLGNVIGLSSVVFALVSSKLGNHKLAIRN